MAKKSARSVSKTRSSARTTVKKALPKSAAESRAAKSTPKRSASAKSLRSKTPVKKSVRKPGAKKSSTILGRPRIAATAELDQLFLKDYEAREVFHFLGLKTLKELETLSPQFIIDRLTAPLVATITRIRKALAFNNRCLSGDEKFAADFRSTLPR